MRTIGTCSLSSSISIHLRFCLLVRQIIQTLAVYNSVITASVCRLYQPLAWTSLPNLKAPLLYLSRLILWTHTHPHTERVNWYISKHVQYKSSVDHLSYNASNVSISYKKTPPDCAIWETPKSMRCALRLQQHTAKSQNILIRMRTKYPHIALVDITAGNSKMNGCVYEPHCLRSNTATHGRWYSIPT